MRRINVVGTTGSGKSTLARAIGDALSIPVIELDALHWQPGWTEEDPEVLRDRVRRAVEQPAWVVDGNYSKVRDIVWPAADTIVWLDYSFLTVAWRLWRRTLRRGLFREELWNGNRERLWVQFFTRDSLLLWFLRTWKVRRQDYPAELDRFEADGGTTHRFRRPADTDRFLADLRSG